MSAIRKAVTNLQIAAYPDPSISQRIEPLGHSYPWQMYTRSHGIQLTAQLEGAYPADELQAELREVMTHYAPQQQFGQYHAGGWTGVALKAIDGDPLEDRDLPNSTFAKTDALKYAPVMESIIDALPGEKRRVRLLQLDPGKKIFWHRDLAYSVDTVAVRLHIPIVTNAKVDFQISHQDCNWKPGELWYGDFTFPHRLQNGGDEGRIHLVVDIINCEDLRALLPSNLSEQLAKRTRARQRCISFLKWYNRVFATEQRLRRDKVLRAS